MTMPTPSMIWPDPTTPLALAGKRLHFVGIGGCGMSGLARMAAKQGAICTGTDMNESDTIDTLRASGINVSLDQSGAALPGAGELDMLVISAAIKPTHPEVVEATQRGAQVVKYAQLLGRLMVGRVGVAIAGTHGKSTTTSILSHILIQTGLDPSFIVGAHCEQIGGGVRVSVRVGYGCRYAAARAIGVRRARDRCAFSHCRRPDPCPDPPPSRPSTPSWLPL